MTENMVVSPLLCYIIRHSKSSDDENFVCKLVGKDVMRRKGDNSARSEMEDILGRFSDEFYDIRN